MKSVRFILLLVCVCAALTACSTNTATVESSPTAPLETATQAPTEAATQQPAEDANTQTDTFIAVGGEAVITVGGTKLQSPAYYPNGDEKTMLLPFVETCKALGWQVEEPSGTGEGEMKLTQSGMDEIVVKLNVPADKNASELKGVTAVKAGAPVDAAGEPFAWIDGQLYATEKFISAAVQQISVEYDGEKSITVNAKA